MYARAVYNTDRMTTPHSVRGIGQNDIQAGRGVLLSREPQSYVTMTGGSELFILQGQFLSHRD